MRFDLIDDSLAPKTTLSSKNRKFERPNSSSDALALGAAFLVTYLPRCVKFAASNAAVVQQYDDEKMFSGSLILPCFSPPYVRCRPHTPCLHQTTAPIPEPSSHPRTWCPRLTFFSFLSLGFRPALPVLRVGAYSLHLAGRPLPESGSAPRRRRRF